MPRNTRVKSESGIYHIMLRGINQQLIFEDEEDDRKFLEVLKDCKAVSGYKLFAYCLMGNHIHLLIKVEKEDLEQIFKRIGGRYVYWYNGKYSRAGHLFQDRYKSEPVETDEYFLTVLRYIHQNPVNANISKKVIGYLWSSYNEYVNPIVGQLTDTDFVLEMIGKDEFVRFNNQVNDDKCLELEEKKFRLTDEQAKKVMAKISKCDSASEFQELDIKNRDKYIRAFKENDMSVRQISRLTGISFGIVRKI
jgi:REP element-mobilizing transposase RayT